MHVARVVHACDDPILDVSGEQMTSRVDLLLKQIVDRASIKLKAAFFFFFFGVLVSCIDKGRLRLKPKGGPTIYTYINDSRFYL